jgi:hypothetical protein
MKKSKNATLTLSVFFMSTFGLYASLIVTPGISETDFNNAFSNDRVWYAQFQPGGAGTTHPDNEFEHGGTTLRYFEGNTSTFEETDNPFEVNVSGTAFLSTVFNGTGTPGGSAFGITEAFNTIWIGLRLAKGDNAPNNLEVNTHSVDGTAVLPDMFVETITDGPDLGWTAFKFYDDQQLTNFSNGISVTGNINPDMFFGGGADEDWTYTVFATQDTSIIPEPSTFALLFGGLMTAITFASRNKKSQQDRRDNSLSLVPHD